MASRVLLCIICVYSAGLLATAAQPGVSHYRPRREPALSNYNPATKNWEPVTWDSLYSYYRMKLNFNETFFDFYQPDPDSPSVGSLVGSGDVFDNTTGIKVGTYNSFTVSTAITDGGELVGLREGRRSNLVMQQYLTTQMAVEFGPDNDDAIFSQAAYDLKDLYEEPTDFEIAITGGKGRYKGATGEAQFYGTAVTEPNSDNLYVVEMAVPQFKRF